MTESQATIQDYTLPLIQALLFVGSVYIEKLVRKKIAQWPKKYKQISRICFVAVLTLFLLLYSFSNKCQPHGVNINDCFYLHFDIVQNVHVIIANTILFGYNIYHISTVRDSLSFGDSPIRRLIFAPLLQQLLFRAVFYRSSNGKVSIFYLSAIFSICHLHRHVRKAVSGKSRKLRAALFQLFFTFIFSLYEYYWLHHYKSLIPCIVLHVYCNFLGTPIISGKNSIIFHLVCIVAFFLYIAFVA